MRNLILILLLFFSFSINAQKRGLNNDPFSDKIGIKPYEMEGRAEHYSPIATFEDASKWIVYTKNVKAGLYTTREMPLFRDKTGKLVYTPLDKDCQITLKLESPVLLTKEFDCIDFWTYGDHWLWGKPHYKTACRYYALIEDADGKQHQIDFSQAGYKGLIHKYWFLGHIKIKNPVKLPAKFIGVRFKGTNALVNQKFTIYLGPVYTYKEVLSPLTFEKLPGKLPFPTSKETILPEIKTNVFTNNIVKDGNVFRFIYKDDANTLEFRLKAENNIISNIKTYYNGKENIVNQDAYIKLANGKKVNPKITRYNLNNDTLYVNSTINYEGLKHDLNFWFTIKQKTLITGISQTDTTGFISEINLGTVQKGDDAVQTIIPFLGYGSGRIPFITYTKGLFYFKQFDWYYTNASDVIAGKRKYIIKYIPKTNGVLNPVREKIFINVSDNVQEVFPTVDNPKSPMRMMMAHRLWLVDGRADYKAIKKSVKYMRALGMKHIAVRYHEGFWRDGGESYTFRTQTAPGHGGNKAVQNLVEYIKSKGWLVGLYSNYTDLAPVNKNWNPDWVMRGPNGEWNVSWSRCYAPKPVIAWEMEKHFAPIIHKEFGTNFSYCDVHTAVSPIARVDYDYRVPGAAMLRQTYTYFGLLLLNEKKSYHGPVYSEGNYHWMYAGLTDGNYANAPINITRTPVFPDFYLQKVNILEMDAGNVDASGAKYITYTLAYGNIGRLAGDTAEMIRRYAMLQPLQDFYSMVPVKTIKYYADGKFHNSSEAVIKRLTHKPKLFLEYESGLKVYINFSSEPWHVEDNGKSFELPQYGFLACQNDYDIISFFGKASFVKSDTNIYYSQSRNQYYFDSNGDEIITENFSCKGKVFLTNEKFGWEIVPALDFENFSFNKNLLGYKENIQIEGENINDRPVVQVKFENKDGKIYFEHKNKKVLKYRISPLFIENRN